MVGETQKRVVVFTTPTCSWCTKLKNYLRQNNVRYKEIDISKDASAARDVMKKTGQTGVPVTFIDNAAVVGFAKDKIDKLLGLTNK